MKHNASCILLFLVLISSSLSAEEPDESDYLNIGGALRFNAAVQNYEQSNKDLDTYMKMDTWFLSADARLMGFDLSIQYRFYSEFKMHFLHHGYIGYQIDDKWYGQLGVLQKPFGIGPAASHSWWYQAPYYIGLEDAYSTGLNFSYKHDKLAFDLAYFRQAAPKGPIDSDSQDNGVGNGRFSYAIVPTTGYADGQLVDANIRELDQFNIRARYHVLKEVELGFSAQFGSIYNREIDRRKWGLTWAAHTQIDYNRWNFKGEVIGYNYNALGNDGQKLDIIQMGAFGATQDVAAKGMVYVAGLSYKIPVNRKFITSIEPYVDYSVVDKKVKSYKSTHYLIPGVLITSGPIYTYVDYAWGKNTPTLTSQEPIGLGAGSRDARWNSRFNINIGYYFNFKI